MLKFQNVNLTFLMILFECFLLITFNKNCLAREDKKIVASASVLCLLQSSVQMAHCQEKSDKNVSFYTKYWHYLSLSLSHTHTHAHTHTHTRTRTTRRNPKFNHTQKSVHEWTFQYVKPCEKSHCVKIIISLSLSLSLSHKVETPLFISRFSFKRKEKSSFLEVIFYPYLVVSEINLFWLLVDGQCACLITQYLTSLDLSEIFDLFRNASNMFCVFWSSVSGPCLVRTI